MSHIQKLRIIVKKKCLQILYANLIIHILFHQFLAHCAKPFIYLKTERNISISYLTGIFCLLVFSAIVYCISLLLYLFTFFIVKHQRQQMTKSSCRNKKEWPKNSSTSEYNLWHQAKTKYILPITIVAQLAKYGK